MILIGVITLSVLALTAFCVKKRYLHLFELLAIWFSVAAINSPIYSFFLVNKHWISAPDNKELAIVRIMYSELLCPLLLTWILEQSHAGKNTLLRYLCYVGAFTLLLLGGLALHLLGVVHFTRIGTIWYIPFKFILLICAIMSIRLMRYLMRKDGIEWKNY